MWALHAFKADFSDIITTIWHALAEIRAVNKS